ncbi:MAG: RNA methyltransferase [Verrucomicrobiales bacterium]|nr:RNA methyltransferase [Verrucomicrobiales bacterium]
MARLKQQYDSDGYFGIGIFHSAEEQNIGTLWRSAYILGASFIFTIGRKYRKQSSDVTKAWSRIPLYYYEDFDEFKKSIPYSSAIVAVEMTDTAVPLESFEHPKRAVYLLGNEADGLPPTVVSQCHKTVVIPGDYSLNVAVAGSIIIYDRGTKVKTSLPGRPG